MLSLAAAENARESRIVMPAGMFVHLSDADLLHALPGTLAAPTPVAAE